MLPKFSAAQNCATSISSAQTTTCALTSGTTTISSDGSVSVSGRGDPAANAITVNVQNAILNNAGTISSRETGSFTSGGAISGGSSSITGFTLNNSGTISGQTDGDGSARAIFISNTTTATGNFSINNTGTITSGTTKSGSNRQNIFLNVGSSASPSTLTLTNQSAGVISDTSSGAVNGTAISLGLSTSFMSANITNYGTISGPSGTNGSIGITMTGGAAGNTNTYNLSNLGGTISTNGATTSRAVNVATSNTVINNITNTGTISSGSVSASSSKVGIYNFGTITTLNNLQGASGSALTYYGKLPTNYGIIINGASSLNTYGRLAVSIPTGSMAFGIYSGGISGAAASTVTAGTYYGVLQGFSTLGSVTGTTGTYGGLNYSLVADSTNFNGSCSVGCWNLVFGTSSNIQSGTNRFSDIGGSLSAKFDGGTLTVDIAGSKSDAFTVTGNNGVIDHAGRSATFSGNITDDSGAQGKITIANTGTAGTGKVTFAGTNTYSGGTEVQAGAALSISSANNLGSGRLALIGSSTVPATLYTTADMTISNSITVTGDPVFNVASGTTTTISAPITDGASAGDVVVSGGGTLALTAINTYTGNTTIDSGSTLVLSGNGSIATSGTDATIGTGVFNNGIFNVSGVTANTVSIGTNFTQSSTGTLAMNFSPTNNQKLIVTGTASLAGSLSLAGSAGTYRPGRYSLLSASSITGTFGSLSSNLSSLTTLGYQLAYDAANVYLVFTPNVADTQQSLVNTVSALQNTYTLQNSILANSFSYDCNEFGANGICISVGGRNTTVSASNGLNNTSGLLIAAYRPHPNYRIGAYADQNLSVSNPGGTVNLGNNTPLLGLFGAWNERLDGTGAEIKASAAYGQKNTTITRSVVGTSESGTGSSQLNSQGAQVTAKYGFAVMPAMIISPYVGIRYAQNNMGGYTETTSATVTAPLTYSALNTNATTALAGLGASYRLTPVVTTFASAGVETDTNTSNGTYSATGITGLTPINFNANPVKTRPTATLGAYYGVAKNQRLGVTGIYRQEPYQAVSTTAVMATYTIGL